MQDSGTQLWQDIEFCEQLQAHLRSAGSARKELQSLLLGSFDIEVRHQALVKLIALAIMHDGTQRQHVVLLECVAADTVICVVPHLEVAVCVPLHVQKLNKSMTCTYMADCTW
jgi:hypothetical protein